MLLVYMTIIKLDFISESCISFEEIGVISLFSFLKQSLIRYFFFGKFIRKLMILVHFCQFVCSDQRKMNDKENKETSNAPTKKVWNWIGLLIERRLA